MQFNFLRFYNFRLQKVTIDTVFLIKFKNYWRLSKFIGKFAAEI